MTKEIQTLSEEMENLSARILSDLQSTLVNLSGNLKDIDYGTHIKIPMGAGYVKFYKSADAWNLSCWISENLMDLTETEKEYQTYLNDEDIHGKETNTAKSE